MGLWTGLHTIIALEVRHIGIGAVRMVSDRISRWTIVRMWHIIPLMHRWHSTRIVAVHLQTNIEIND